MGPNFNENFAEKVLTGLVNNTQTHSEKTYHWETQFPNEHVIGLSHESAFPKK